MSAQDYFAVVDRRRRRSSVISLFRHRDGPVKKIKFSQFFKNKQSFQNSRFLGKMSARDFFAVVGRRRRRSSVISLFRHRDGPVKKIKFSPFFKNKQSFQNSRFLGKMSARDFFAVVGRRRRRSSVISLFRHRDGPVKKIKFSPFFKNKQSFQNSRFLGKMSAQDYFAVVDRRRRRSSVISLFRHRDGPVKKIKFSPFFKNKQSFQNSRFLGKMSARDYFAVVGRRRRRSSVISLFRHRDGPVKKIKFSPFFKNKQSFQNSRFLGKMSARDYFAVVDRRRRRSSVISLFRHRDGPVKKIKFSPFFKNKQSFQNSRFLGKMSARDYFAVVGRRRRRSSVISLFRHRDGPVKKIKFSPFFKNKQSFQNSRFLGKMSARDYFAVVGRRRRRSSVISLFRHRDGPVKKIKFSPFFKNKQSFQNSRFLGKMSARDYFAVVGRRRRRSSVISLFRHRDGPVKKIKFSPFFKNKQSFHKFKIFWQNECTRLFRRRRSSPSSVVRHFPLSSQGRTCEKNQIFAVFQKQAIFPKFKIFRQNECTRFFRRRRSSPSSVVRHFPLSSQGRTCEKNQIFAVFQKQAIFPKFKIFRQNECTRFFRRRRSSPSSVVRHFPLSSQGRTCEKNQIFAVFQKQAIFPKFKIFRQNECTRFFRRRRSSPSSVVRHFPLSSQGRTCEKNQIFAVFQKQAIFPKFKIFRQNECTRLFRRRRSSPSSVVRHFPLSSQGRTCEKNQIFAVFQKQAIFHKFKIFRQNECTRFFRRRRSSPSSVVRHFHLSSQGRTCEKNQIFAVFQKQAIFPKFKIFRQNECTRFFRRRRSSPSSVVRHFPLSSQGRTCEKKSNFRRFSKTSNLSKIQDF